MSDKSAGQWVGSIIGAVIGFITGGPMGAIYGASLGAGIGGMIDPPKGPTIHGPRLNDLTVQGSTFGAPLARVYGTVALHGNVIWLENNKIKEVVRKKKQGGKNGGGGSTVKTYHYYGTFAVGLTDCPPNGIKAVRRIWVGSELLYNGGSDDLETILASNRAWPASFSMPLWGNVFRRLYENLGIYHYNFGIYPGTDDQLPEPRIEADLGVGNAPAFRGTAYIMFYDLPLEKWGNSLMGAQVKVELVTAAHSEIQLIKTIEVPVYPFGHNTTTGVISAFDRDHKFWAISRRIYDGTAGALTELSVSGRAREHQVKFPGSFPSGRTVYVLGGESDKSEYWLSHDSAPLGTRWISNGSGNMSIGTQLAADYVWDKRDTGTYVHLSSREGGSNPVLRKINIDLLLWVNEGEIPVNPVGTSSGVAVGEGMVLLLDKMSSTVLRIRVYDADLDFQREFEITDFPAGVGIASKMTIVAGNLFVVTGINADNIVIRQISIDDEVQINTYTVDLPGVAPNTNAGTRAFTFRDGVFVYSDQYASPDLIRVYYFQLGSMNIDGVYLSDVVGSELGRTQLITPGDVNVSDLSADLVRGYRIAGVQQVRACLAPLQAAWPFDVIMSGYQLKAVRRGKSSVATIPVELLDARAYDEAPGVQLDVSREMDSQLPRQVMLRHLDSEREHDINEQRSSERQSTQAVDVREIELPLVLTPDEAAGVADVLFNVAWLERESVSFRLPPLYLGLEPADVITIDAPYGQFELRLMEINYLPDGRLECSARPNAAANYTSVAVGGVGPVPDGNIALPGDTETVLLDIPLIRNDDDEPGFGAAMASDTGSWPGGVLFRSTDNEQTWTDVQAWSAPVTMGYGRDPLPAHDGRVIDRISQLRVDLLTGELEGITEAQMMTGIHWAAYGADGRWELMRFADAALQSDGSYILTTLLRGLRGSEWATGLHQFGDAFVFLDDPDVMFVGADLPTLGVVRQWRGASAGQTIDDAESIDFAYRGVNLLPLSPVHGTAQQSGADWVLAWDARTRLQGSLWKTGVALPVGEADKRYEIEILDGATVKRILTATTETAIYTEAQQIEDFGSPQSSITARAYQLSQSVGRGYPHEITA
ncbi:MAG: phage tail protein [Porticoccaceae bacterium]|nr:phage tail protein [Porticoccaceae bacterium]